MYEYVPSEDDGPGGKCTTITQSKYDRARKKWMKAFRCVSRQADDAYYPGGPDLSLDVQQQVLPGCGWKPDSVREALAFFFPWLFIDFEYGTPNVPLADIFDAVNGLIYFVNDKRGFDFVPRNFQDIHNITVDFGKRVTSIKYNVSDDVYPGLVTTVDANTNNCTEWKAKHVLLTVPIGVYESGAISFDPLLLYPQAPYKQQQFSKIFYQFKTKFWDDKEFIVALKQSGNEGICHHWQNLNYVNRCNQKTGPLGTAREFYPGSKILFCTLNSEAMKVLLGEDNIKTTNLSYEQLRGVLLDPLHAVYGSKIVDSNLENVYDPQLNTNPDTGFGAYSNFQGDKDPSGDVIKNMYNFFGGDVPGVDIERCDHNGCADINGVEKWVLHMGGTASCFENYELVAGAIDSGDRSANYIAKELGYDVSTLSPNCEDFFVPREKDRTAAGTRHYLRRSEPHWVHF